MKRLLTTLAIVLLTGCATNQGIVKKDVELVKVPVPYCPAPPDVKIPKENGIEYIKPNTPPGEVAKAYDYEVTYQKGLNKIYAAILDMYKSNNVSSEKLKEEIEKMIDATNAKLKKTQNTTPTPTKTP